MNADEPYEETEVRLTTERRRAYTADLMAHRVSRRELDRLTEFPQPGAWWASVDGRYDVLVVAHKYQDDRLVLVGQRVTTSTMAGVIARLGTNVVVNADLINGERRALNDAAREDAARWSRMMRG